MKKSLTLFTLLLATFVQAQTWTPMSVGSVAQVLCISFPDCDTGYASMDNNTLRKTVDGAATWTTCAMPTQPNLEIDFPTSQRGFMVCQHGLSMTTDGAQTWNPVVTNNAIDFWDVTFVTPAVGYVSGTNTNADTAYIYKTTDGGSTWTLLPLLIPPVNIFVSYMYFYSPTVGFLSGDGTIFKTTDGGATWNTVYTGPSDIWQAIHSADGTNYYQATFGANTASSSDGGASWTAGTPFALPCYGLYFTSATHGFQCGGDGFSTGSIEETNDSGVNWAPVYTGTTMWTMDFPSPACGYAAGMGGVIVKYSEAMSVATNSAAQFNCYPNPATDFFTIENISPGSGITITNTLGEILEQRLAIDTKEMFYLSEPGLYFVNVREENGVTITKAITVK